MPLALGDCAIHKRLKALGFKYKKKTLEGCLIPKNNGVLYEESDSWRKSLWNKYYMQKPEQRRQSVERSVIVKRA